MKRSHHRQATQLTVACPRCFRTPCTCNSNRTALGGPAKTKKRGTARMIEQGYKPIQLWLSPTTHANLQRLAEKNSMTMTGYAASLIHAKLAYEALANGQELEKGADPEHDGGM